MPLEVYAFSNTDEVLKVSSSGGAFPAVAESFFQNNADAIVYAVSYDADLIPQYTSAKKISECAKFSGSKYVKADMNDVYKKVYKDLERGSSVLFVGTPCAVFALKNNLQKKNLPEDKLFTVDIICHGTPLKKYWIDYKNWLQKKYKDKLLDFSFRTHFVGNSPYTCCAKFSKRTVVGSLEISLFNRLFLRHYLFPTGCFQCKFANLNRVGDLTLGDFWGIDKVMSDFPKKHVSEILVNTQKGIDLLQSIKAEASNKGYIIEQCHSDEYVRYQNNLSKSADKPSNYDQFLFDYQNKPFGYILKKYAHYDIAHRIKHYITKK